MLYIFCKVYMLCYSSSKYCIFRLFKSCKSSSHTDQNSTPILKKFPKSLISSFDQKEKIYNSFQKLGDFLNILKPIEEEILQFYFFNHKWWKGIWDFFFQIFFANFEQCAFNISHVCTAIAVEAAGRKFQWVTAPLVLD